MAKNDGAKHKDSTHTAKEENCCNFNASLSGTVNLRPAST